MALTKEQAKTKICPHLTISQAIYMQSMAGLVAANPEVKGVLDNMKTLSENNVNNCQASDCMMWIRTSMPSDEHRGHCGLINR